MNCVSRVVLASAFACIALPCQCLITTVSTQSIGPGCNAASTGFCLLPSTPTTLTVTLDPSVCQLDVEVVAFSGCGASIPLRALAIGLQPAAIPLPQFGPTCTLRVAPILLLATTSGPFSLPLPPNVPSLTLYAQGFALSQPPFGALIPTLSNGVEITLQ